MEKKTTLLIEKGLLIWENKVRTFKTKDTNAATA